MRFRVANSKRLVIGVVVFTLFGCFGNVKDVNYYQLDYVPTPMSMVNDVVYPYTVRVKDFDVAEAYRRNNIVYRQSPYELRFYNYEQWVARPEYLVADMLFRHLEAAKIFSEIRRSVDSEEPDFIISGTIRALEEYDNQDEWYAHLAINMFLHDYKMKKVIWSKEWAYRKKVSNLETIYVVRGLSELLERINNEAITDIDSIMRTKFAMPAKMPAPIMPAAAPVVPVVPAPIARDSIELEVLPPPGEIE